MCVGYSNLYYLDLLSQALLILESSTINNNSFINKRVQCLKPVQVVLIWQVGLFYRVSNVIETRLVLQGHFMINPISTGTGWNQPIYEYHVTTAGRNKVKLLAIAKQWLKIF